MADTATAAPAASRIRTASGINIILGIWLIVAPFVLETTGAAYWNEIVLGVIVTILAVTRTSKPTSGTRPASWINAIIGVWLIVSPFVLGYTYPAALWNEVIVGILVLAFGAWSASMPRRPAAPAGK